MSTRTNAGFYRKIFYLFAVSALLSPLSFGAVPTFKGQLVYLKECRVCHLSSRIFVETHSSQEWEKMLDTDGTRLSDIHLKVEERFVSSKERIRKSSHKFFKSESYAHKYTELRDFVIESAKKNEAIEANYR